MAYACHATPAQRLKWHYSSVVAASEQRYLPKDQIGMAQIIMAQTVMAQIVMAQIVMAYVLGCSSIRAAISWHRGSIAVALWQHYRSVSGPNSYGLNSYGLNSYGLCLPRNTCPTTKMAL